jgi:autotransporter-associated beta strand protein
MSDCRLVFVLGVLMCSQLGGGTPCTASPNTETFLDRSPSDVRVVTFNVLWDSIFSRVNATRAEGFSRLAAALAPDVWAFQELWYGNPSSTETELKSLLDTIQPIQGGWNVFKSGALAIASRWPITERTSNISPVGAKPVMAAFVDLPDAEFPVDLYLMNAHFKCCGGFDYLRQRDSDAIVSWMRDARTPGGEVELPYATPMVVLGDLNIVGGPQPLSTLVTGDIQDNSRYGADSAPDWDGSVKTVLDATHNGVAGADTYTWRNDLDRFAPGRLDYMVYTDSVLTPTKGFVLNTAAMSETDLAATGLQPFDSVYDGTTGFYDHLPVVMDFQIQPAASLAVQIEVDAGTRTQAEAGYSSIPLAPSLTKAGAGSLILDAINMYTGPTSILGGTLAIDSPAALSQSSLIESARDAVFDVGAVFGYTVSSGQTLAGSGTVLGSVTFGRGSTLSPGLSEVGSGEAMLSAHDTLASPQAIVVPEPATLGLMAVGCGFLGLGAVRRRRLVWHVGEKRARVLTLPGGDVDPPKAGAAELANYLLWPPTPCPAAGTDLRILDRATKPAIQKPLFSRVADGIRTRYLRYHKPAL